METETIGLIEGAFTELVPQVHRRCRRKCWSRSCQTIHRNAAARELSAWIDKTQQLGIGSGSGSNLRAYTAVIGVDRGFDWSLPELRELPAAFVRLTLPILYRSNGALGGQFRIPYRAPIPAAFQHARV